MWRPRDSDDPHACDWSGRYTLVMCKQTFVMRKPPPAERCPRPTGRAARLRRRYNVPRLAFINKLDREGSDPDAVVQALRSKLHLNATALQLPMGLSKEHVGVIDLVMQQAYFFEGHNGPLTARAMASRMERM